LLLVLINAVPVLGYMQFFVDAAVFFSSKLIFWSCFALALIHYCRLQYNLSLVKNEGPFGYFTYLLIKSSSDQHYPQAVSLFESMDIIKNTLCYNEFSEKSQAIAQAIVFNKESIAINNLVLPNRVVEFTYYPCRFFKRCVEVVKANVLGATHYYNHIEAPQ